MLDVQELIKLKGSYLRFIKPGVESWTRDNAAWQLDYFFDYAAEHHIPELTIDSVVDWINSLVEKNLGHETILKYVRRLKQFLDWAVTRQTIPAHPVQWDRLPRWGGKARKERQCFTDQEYTTLTNLLIKRADVNWYHAIVVGRMTGLRISDVCHLTKSAANWKTETLELTPIKTKKFGKTVTIPMRAELFEVLNTRRSNPEFEFPGHEKYFFGEFHLSYKTDMGRSMRRQFKYRCGLANIRTDLSFHCLRHTFVSKLANADVSYKVIKSITGQSIRQIAEYHHVDLEAQRAAIMKA